MANINVRVDDDLKEKADALFDELGLNLTTAIVMFLRPPLLFPVPRSPPPFAVP